MIVNKKWGHEIWIENNDFYCGKRLHVLPTKWSSVHYHKNKKETFFVIDGSLELQFSSNLDKDIWDKNLFTTKILNLGESITLDPMVAHRFTAANGQPCDFMEISTHHDDDDTYRIIESV